MERCRQSFMDQMGRKIEMSLPPERIVSLVPSQTELLFDLGLDDHIVGITKFCIHPAQKVQSVAKVGGTKQLRLDKIRELKPDLIIGNKEENEKGQIDQLMNEFPVWMSDIQTLEEAFEMMKSIGEITDRSRQAEKLVNEIRLGFGNIRCSQPPSVQVAYFIWREPYMAAGKNTFIDEMLQTAGWKNVFEDARYPVVSTEEIRKANPDVIFLSSEPYPFKQKHIEEFMQICPSARIFVVDGELFSWYGSRLRYTPEYLISLKSIVNQNERNNNENMF